MKFVNKIILIISLIFILSGNVYAINYADPSIHNFSDWRQIDLQLSGSTPGIVNIEEDQDGNYIMLAWYRDILLSSGSTNIPGVNEFGQASPSGTPTREHSKLIKYDKNFNKIFEKDYYIQGNFETDEPYAPTVATKLYTLAVLADGSYVAAGQTWGLLGDTVDSDGFNPIFVHFDKDGNVLFEGNYVNTGLEEALTVEALTDGGYIVKFYYEGSLSSKTQPPSIFPVDTVAMFYYVVYNSSNQIVAAFGENEKNNVYSYSFIDDTSINDLLYTTGGHSEKEAAHLEPIYIGTGISGEPYYVQANKRILMNDYFMSSSVKFNTHDKAISGHIYTSNRPLLLNNGAAIYPVSQSVIGYVDKYEYSGIYFKPNGSYDSKINNFAKGSRFFVTSENTIINYGYSISLFVNKATPRGENSTIYIINGQEIQYDLGTFIENDRTYINLNSLCSALNCNYSTPHWNSNRLLIRFNLLKNNKQVPENFETYDSQISNYAFYTIVHDVGTKEYKSYIEFLGYKAFALKSPTFHSDGVDVTSKYINGQVYVPLRFVSEALGRYVEYVPAGEDGRAKVIISAQGEGEFYQKYDVGISTKSLSVGNTFANGIDNSRTQSLNGRMLYVYGLEKSTKTVLDSKSVFFPINNAIRGVTPSYETPAEDLEKGYIYDNVTTWDGRYVCKGNTLHIEAITNKEEDDYYEEIIITTVAISNIEGYPFIKLINLKG